MTASDRHLRRLDWVEAHRSRLPPQPAGPRRDSDEAFAAMNLVILAKDLAGLAEPVYWAAEKEAEERAAEVARQMAQSRAWSAAREKRKAPPDGHGPTPGETRRRWSQGRRPGPFDVLTWDEAMQVPWIGVDDHDD
jgi:hypothetical protein